MSRRLEAMKEFVFAAAECRVRGMLRYFGEKDAGECGKCDVCRAARRREATRSGAEQQEMRKSIIYRVSQPGGTTVESLVGDLRGSREEIVAEIRRLADSGEIILDGTTLRSGKE